MKSYKLIVAVSALLSMTAYAAGPQGGPPQEAFDACSGFSEGDSCSVETPEGTLEGTCRLEPRDSKTLCVPENGSGEPPARG